KTSNFSISGATITSVSLPKFSTLYYDFNGSYSIAKTSITSFNLPFLSSLPSANLFFSLNQNKLTSASVNGWLAKLVSMNITGAYINTYGQTPAAPPTGQGTLDK